jgi:hypothetical protein
VRHVLLKCLHLISAVEQILSYRAQQKLLMKHTYECLQSENTDSLFDELLTARTEEQRVELSSTLDLSTFEYYLFVFARFPTTIRTAPLRSPGVQTRAIWDPTNINSQQSPRNPVEALHSGGARVWIRGNPYFVLLQLYLEEMLPQAGTLKQDSGLFLRILIECWIERASVVRQRFDIASALTEPQNSYGLYAESPRLIPLTTVILLDDADCCWTPYTLQCVYLVCVHVLSSQKYRQACVMDDYVPLGSLTSDLQSKPFTNLDDVQEVALALQQPLFDMLRVILSRPEQLESLTVEMAIEIWLLWLQPWKAECNSSHKMSSYISDISRTSMISGQPAEPFKAEWRLHVIRNYHLYTTLAIIFLKGAAKLTSRNLHDRQLHLRQLKAMLLLYNSELRHVLQTAHVAMDRIADDTPIDETPRPLYFAHNEQRATEIAILTEHHDRLFPDKQTCPACATRFEDHTEVIDRLLAVLRNQRVTMAYIDDVRSQLALLFGGRARARRSWNQPLHWRYVQDFLKQLWWIVLDALAERGWLPEVPLELSGSTGRVCVPNKRSPARDSSGRLTQEVRSCCFTGAMKMTRVRCPG